MPTKLITKYSTTATAAPSSGDLDTGELAVNVADKRLYTEDDSDNVVEIGTNPSTITLGNAVDTVGDIFDIWSNGTNYFVQGTVKLDGGAALA